MSRPPGTLSEPKKGSQKQEKRKKKSGNAGDVPNPKETSVNTTPANNQPEGPTDTVEPSPAESTSQASAPQPESSFLNAIKNRIWGKRSSQSAEGSQPQPTAASEDLPQQQPSEKVDQSQHPSITENEPNESHAAGKVTSSRSTTDGKQKKRKRRSSPDAGRDPKFSNRPRETTDDIGPSQTALPTPENTQKRRKKNTTKAPSASGSSVLAPLADVQQTPLSPLSSPDDGPTSAQRVQVAEPPSTQSSPSRGEPHRFSRAADKTTKASNRTQAKTNVTSSTGTTEAAVQSTASTQEPPPKRPRGRPPKNPQTSSQNHAPSSQQSRPSTSRTQRSSMARTDDSEEDEDEARPGPRGRGRPHKSEDERVESLTTDKEGRRLSHQEILNSGFIKTPQLLLLERKIGLQYIKGPFKQAEDAKLKAFIDAYCEQARLDIEGFRDLLFQDGALRGETFWQDLTAQITGRPLISVYHHIRRMFHADARQGEWTQAEDRQLQRLVRLYGRAWESISGSMSRRTGPDCKDRWDNHVRFQDSHGHVKSTGTWTEEEEHALVQAVNAITRELGEERSRGQILWTKVAERVGTRSRQQCALKWVESVRAKTEAAEEGKKPKWKRKKHTLELIRRVRAVDAEYEDEIPWKDIRAETPEFEPFSASQLRKRWLRAKERATSNLDDPDSLSLPEVVDLALAAHKAKDKRAWPQSMRDEASEAWALKEAAYEERRAAKRAKGLTPGSYKSTEFIDSSDDE